MLYQFQTQKYVHNYTIGVTIGQCLYRSSLVLFRHVCHEWKAELNNPNTHDLSYLKSWGCHIQSHPVPAEQILAYHEPTGIYMPFWW